MTHPRILGLRTLLPLMPLMPLMWGLAVALLPAVPVSAKTVFRCEEPGRVIYADEPCGKSSKTVNVDDARTAEQRKEALEATKREAEFARKAKVDREASERQAATVRAAGIESLPRADPQDAVPAKPKRELLPKVKPAKLKVSETKAASKSSDAPLGTIRRSPEAPAAKDKDPIPTVKLSPPKS